MLDMGFGDVYVRSDNPTDELKNTLFTLNFFTGMINFIILIVSSPIIASFYEKPILMQIIIVFAVSILFTAISRQAQAYLLREKKFKELMKVSIFTNFISFLVIVLFAYYHFGVWALVFGSIASTLINALMLFYFANIRYKLVNIATIKNFLQNLNLVLKYFLLGLYFIKYQVYGWR